MTPDRLDDLLERALETGEIPADATAEERTDLAPLLAGARELKLNAARVSAEADGAMPTARARFQRHLAGQASSNAPVVPVSSPQRGVFGRFFAGRAMTFATSGVALAVVAVLAIVVLRPFSSPETASALEIDDYVQLEGVVSETSDGFVTVQAPDIGDLEVALSAETSVTTADGAAAGDLSRGDSVLVSGVVTDKRAIKATNVAVSKNQAAPPPGSERKLSLLKDLRPGLEGRISVLSLSPDGREGRVVILTPSGGRILVPVAPASMDQFLASEESGIGVAVRVEEGASPSDGLFELSIIERDGPATQRPQFQNVRGVVVGRNMNVLQVRTDRGVIPVVLRPLTSVRFGQSGLTPEDLRGGETVVGYEISIAGNPEGAESRRLIASLIVVVGKAPDRPGGQ